MGCVLIDNLDLYVKFVLSKNGTDIIGGSIGNSLGSIKLLNQNFSYEEYNKNLESTIKREILLEWEEIKCGKQFLR